MHFKYNEIGLKKETKKGGNYTFRLKIEMLSFY